MKPHDRERARRHFAGRIAGHGHHDDQGDAAGGERQPCGGGVVAEQLLHELRLQDGVGVEHAAHQHHEEAADCEVLEAEQPQVDDRFFGGHSHSTSAIMPPTNSTQKKRMKSGGEPVVLLALVEHDLHAAHGDGEKAQAQEVHVAQARAVGLDPRRIVDQAGDQNEGQDAHRNIDEEDPPPREVVGDPAAERGADGRREHGDQSVEREGLAALVRLEGIGHDGLRHGLHAAAARALQTRNISSIGSEGAAPHRKLATVKIDDAEDEEILAAHQAGGPGAQGQHNGIRHQIAGEHPGAPGRCWRPGCRQCAAGPRWRWRCRALP